MSDNINNGVHYKDRSYEIWDKRYTVQRIDELVAHGTLVERPVVLWGYRAFIAGGRSWLQRWMA